MKSSEAVVEPITTTGEALSSSAWVKNRPSATVRARTPSHDGVVPTTLVVQLVLPLTRDASVVETGATAAISGAVAWSDNATASRVVSVEAEPRPPRIRRSSSTSPGRRSAGCCRAS